MMRCFFLAVLLTFLLSHIVYAAPPTIDPMSFDSAATGFDRFYKEIGQGIKSVIQNSVLAYMSLTLWKFFAAVLIVWQLILYATQGLDFAELLLTVFMITVTRILMLQYDTFTSALWGWSEGFATGIQTATVGVSDELFAPRYIWNLMTSISWSSKNFLLAPIQVMTGLILSLTAVLLSILGFFSTVWSLWGYSLAKMIGFMFIPTLLFERLSWLFNGWLRFFFSFLIYNVLARAALILVIVSMHAYFSVPLHSVSKQNGYVLVFNSLVDVLALLTFLIISIVGLLSIGGFVRVIVDGVESSVTERTSPSLSSLRAITKQLGRALR